VIQHALADLGEARSEATFAQGRAQPLDPTIREALEMADTIVEGSSDHQT
jgi:hypothetical protein